MPDLLPARRCRRMSGEALLLTLGTILAISLAVAGVAVAQVDWPALKGTLDTDTLKQREQELEATREEQKQAAEAQKQLKAEIDQLGADRRKLNQDLIDTAARIRDSEGRLSAAEARLKLLEGRESVQRRSLDSQQAVMAEVLAALQRMGRRPPPAVVVRAEDALQSVRSAIMLGAVLPDMREKAQRLAGELAELVRLRNGIAAEKTQLSRDLPVLANERQRMSLLIEERQKRQAEAEKALEGERQRAAALARQVDNLKDLIAKLEQGREAASRAAREAERAPDDHKSDNTTNLAALKDPGRMQPAMAFARREAFYRGRLTALRFAIMGPLKAPVARKRAFQLPPAPAPR